MEDDKCAYREYRELASFQLATLIYDVTVDFCKRATFAFAQQSEQMMMVARAGRLAIVKGMSGGRGNAVGNFESLYLEVEDYLRQNRLPKWSRGDGHASEIKGVWRLVSVSAMECVSDRDWFYLDDEIKDLYAQWVRSEDLTVTANFILCLIELAVVAIERQQQRKASRAEDHHAPRMVDREEQARPRFSKYKERLNEAPSDKLVCPKCGKKLVLRTAKKGTPEESQFWGCSGYPNCKMTRPCD